MLLLLLAMLASDPAPIYTRCRVLRVHCEIDDEGAVPAGRVILMAREPGGEWAPVGEAAPGDPVRFLVERDGVYHLSAVAVGIDGCREEIGVLPEAVVIRDTVPPEIDVRRSLEGTGPAVRIVWTARDDRLLGPDGVGVRLDLGQTDATWTAGNSGKVVLSPPREGDRWTVRLVAVDMAGNRSEAVISFPEVRVDPGVDLAAAAERREAGRAYAMGRSLLSRGMWAAAEEHLRRAVDLSAHDGRVWNDLGVSLSLQGRGEEAREAFGRAVSCSPDDPIPQWNRALGSASIGRAREAARDLAGFSSRRIGAWEGEGLESEVAALARVVRRGGAGFRSPAHHTLAAAPASR